VPRKGTFSTGKLSGKTAALPGRPLNVEMVVLYDNAHEQLEVARPTYEGMVQACEQANQELAAAARDGQEFRPMRITRSEIAMADVPAAEAYVARLEAEGTDGVIFLGYGYLQFPESLAESGFIFEVSRHMPVVLAGAPHAQLPLDSTYCDPRPQLREFLEGCYARGLRRYEFFGTGTSQPHQQERHDEFCQFIMNNGLTWSREYLADDSIEHLTERIRNLAELPEVVVATNISRAVVVALEAQRRGLHLPDDLKLLTFASLERHAEPLTPYASILLMDEPAVGAEAWKLLQERFTSPPQTLRVLNGAAATPRIERVGARFISRH
jgi:DNA-binding LacI/PurR family transcriptional regulator